MPLMDPLACHGSVWMPQQDSQENVYVVRCMAQDYHANMFTVPVQLLLSLLRCHSKEGIGDTCCSVDGGALNMALTMILSVSTRGRAYHAEGKRGYLVLGLQLLHCGYLPGARCWHVESVLDLTACQYPDNFTVNITDTTVL
jgi:hypothetical protein